MGLAIAIVVPWYVHQSEHKTKKKEANLVRLRIPLEIKEIYEEIAFHSARTFLQEHWKDRRYYESRVQLLIERLGQVRGSASGFEAWGLLVDGEKSLSDMAALLRVESNITARVEEFAQKELGLWMGHAFDALPPPPKQQSRAKKS
ncbi:MAG: hypothetical protein KJ945_18725 [Gammaproteobacteria bacterium]|nr:hypothetical protein [Gammaproteobacteria bacterium]MBU0839327.1 hypothetical protein [Gammaproteobacteria bacterium]MBU1803632.1 hypothetical protein [Gammaproteobacteria bacterium]